MVTVILAAAAAGILALGLLLYRWWTVFGDVIRGLTTLNEGGKPRLVMMTTTGPVGRLARAFNITATELHTRVGRLDQERLQLLVVLEAMAEAVIAVDLRHRLLFANASAHQLFGLDHNSTGRLVPELIRSPQVQEAVDATLRLENSADYQGELTIPARDIHTRSQPRTLAVRGTPLPGTPAPGAVLVFHDVSELRRLERMRQDFVANASHELKTPLASIKAYTETLLDWALHDETVNVRFLERIDEQADRLNQLILDLLSLARLDSNHDFFDHQPLWLTPVLEARVEAHRDRAESKSLNLILELDESDQEILVFADEEAVRQILDNLIDNAIKYTPERGLVRISTASTEQEVTIEVSDTGIGIPRDDLARIFERFYRVDKARSRELGGTGLGLSIVKHLVQSIGGRVEVTSRVGSGSTFTVHMPRYSFNDSRLHAGDRAHSSRNT
jgi:two-component system, OmpR family, phosphate regulon sensor histidine kinase PhoR